MTKIPAFRLVAVLAASMVLGCSHDAAVREMQTQRAEIRRESESWRAEITVWKRDVQRMMQWHRSHPGASNRQGPAEPVRSHAEELTAFERDVETFQRDLADLDRRLASEKAAGKRELARHADLWSEHLRLELKRTALAGTNDQLEREQAELAGDSAARH